MTDGLHTSDQTLGAAVEERTGTDFDVAAEPAPVSVLRQVSTRRRQRGRRRKPPAWARKTARGLAEVNLFFSETLPAWILSRRRELTTSAVSFVVHFAVALLLAALLLPGTARDEVLFLIGADFQDELPEQQIQLVELTEVVQPEVIQDLGVNSTMQQVLAGLDTTPIENLLDSASAQGITLPTDAMTDISGVPFKLGNFGGRSEAGRRAAIRKFGGSAESERTVSAGLKWLKSIQRKDGSWNFADVGDAGQPGMLNTTDMGATSLALLCFLGAGHTHETVGDYQETVRTALTYLAKNAQLTSSGADLRGKSQGNSGMYVQGIASICICEASAMTPDDKSLKRLASEAVKFIERAQQKVGGGWRYRPGDPGDTSVVGWQVLALQSAKAGRIKVQADTFQDVRRFLDSVESGDGAFYGYMPDEPPRNSMTAVGLLCRMYLGWKRDRPALKVGVEHLAGIGPSREDIYYDYYATQVLHHWGGPHWDQWNLKMREQLVETQIKEGPAAGSWDVTDPHGYAGGRIYQTALSLLTLEVYYRHLPIYRRFDDKAAE